MRLKMFLINKLINILIFLYLHLLVLVANEHLELALFKLHFLLFILLVIFNVIFQFLFNLWVLYQIDVLFELIHYCPSVDFLGHQHSIFPVDRVPLLFDFLNLLDALDSLDIQIPVVSQRLHLDLLHLQSLVVLELLAMDLSIGFGPLDFFGVVFCLEMQVALSSAESEDLAVVSHELHSVTRVYRGAAEIAFFYSHL